MDQLASPHITSLWIDEELRIVQDQVARFIARDLSPRAAMWETNRQVDGESWRKAAKAGLLCAAVPERYGGGGGTLAYEAVIQQELARAGLGSSFGIRQSVHSGIVAQYILTYGTEAQKVRWLPGMATGDLIGSIAMTEPATGSDLQRIRTSANPSGNGYRLNGQKTFISNGQTSNLVLVAARTGDAAKKVRGKDGGPKNSALSLFVLETGMAEGFRRGRNLEKIGLHAQDTSELFFDDVFLPAETLLGGEAGQGFAQLTHQLGWERMIVALNALVDMERAVEMTTDYTRQRTIFGKPLLEFQNTQFVLADAKTQSTVGRQFVDALMVRLIAGELDAATAAMAKLWLTETSFKVIDACLQLFGGYGYMSEYPISQLFANTRVSRIYGGTSEIMKLIIARSL